MLFEDILPLFRQGKRIQRKCWVPLQVYNPVGIPKPFERIETFCCGHLNRADLLADDWQVYPPDATGS